MRVEKISAFVTPLFVHAQELLAPRVDKMVRQNSEGRAVNVSRMRREFKLALREINVHFHLSYRNDMEGAPPVFWPWFHAFCYAPKSKKEEPAIHVHMHMQRGDKRLLLPPSVWNNMMFRIYCLLQHELVHRYQYLHRQHNPLIYRPAAAAGGKALAKQEYLGSFDEIEAYALEIAQEWSYYIPDVPFTLAMMRDQYRNRGGVPALDLFAETFNQDVNHKAIHALFRKVKQWRGVLTDPIANYIPPCGSRISHAALTKQRTL